jgi:hypothetical protein
MPFTNATPDARGRFRMPMMNTPPPSVSPWSSPEVVARFSTSAPNPELMQFAAAEQRRRAGSRLLDIGCGAGCQAVREAARAASHNAALFVYTFSRNTLPPEDVPIPGEAFVFTGFSGAPQCFLTGTQLLPTLASAPNPTVSGYH